MTTFVVYGVTRQSCRDKALKNISSKHKNGRDKTLTEYADDLKNEEAILWDTMKDGPVTDFFDAPPVCSILDRSMRRQREALGNNGKENSL